MADQNTEHGTQNLERQNPPKRTKSVGLADEGDNELPALLAIAVGIAIIAVALIWPTIAPSGQQVTATGTDEVTEEPESAAATVDTPDLAALTAGVGALGFAGVDLGLEGGVVTAVGEVPDDAARSQVVGYLQNQPGVEAVRDELTVAQAATNNGEATITAAQAAVTLVGTVPDEATEQALVERATAIYSEAQVDNQLTVDPDRVAPTRVTVAGGLTDEVLYNQVSNGFSDVDGVAVTATTITLEDPSDIEDSLNGLDPIQFASGSAIIQPDSEATLDEAAEFLDGNSDEVEIGGHTDSRGGDAANEGLSQARADAVAAALAERGVTNKLTSVGFGERRLKIDPDDTPEAQQQNRRIEFRLLGS